METDGQVYHPNIKEEGTGLYCFMDSSRPCGPECMAFGEPPQQKDFTGKQWANCMLLVAAHRTGKHLTILAQTVDELRKRSEDNLRVNQPPPPPVR